MDLYPLLYALADGRFHSGEALGRQLGVSRAAVWKQVKALQQLDVALHSVVGKGYRLPEPLNLLSRDLILQQLGTPQVDERLALHLTIGSTNVEAMRKAQAGCSRYIVIAEHQSQGKGRRGRSWVSPLGRNIYLSLLWSFSDGISALEGLSLLCALIVVRALKRSGIAGLGVKWPNDVLRDNRKLAGILLEVQGDMTGPCKVVIGIGINVHMPAAAAASIDQPFSDLEGVEVDRNRITAVLIDELFSELDKFASTGFAPYRREWEQSDIYHGREVRVSGAGDPVTGVICGVADGGALLLRTADGIRQISGGEVFPSVRPTTPVAEPE